MPLAASPQKFWSEIRQGTVLIVGMSERTGLPAARLFDQQGVRYRISDSAPRDELEPRLSGLGVRNEDVFAGPQDPAQLEGITQVLLAPGVPRSIPLLREAERRQIPVEVDIDFLYPLMAPRRIVAITGTDGKTTTTTLVSELLRSLGTVVVAGNIGVSVLCVVDEILASEWVVLEVSSFMSEQLSRFRPTIAAVLNVAQDHIDRHASLDEIAAAKLNLVRHGERPDVLALNADDPILMRQAPTHVDLRTFSASSGRADSFFEGDRFHVAGHHFSYADCQLRGVGNIDNILAAATIAHEAGVEPMEIERIVRGFAGVRHRLQHLGCFGGVDVYEDSKASNVHAVETALRSFERNVVLILGGRDKGLDFSILRPHRPRLRQLVCYGEDGEKLREVLGFEGALYAYRFDEAVRMAAAACQPGDVLLLSPGCTSWDQFDNYEVRGDTFQELVPKCFD